MVIILLVAILIVSQFFVPKISNLTAIPLLTKQRATDALSDVSLKPAINSSLVSNSQPSSVEPPSLRPAALLQSPTPETSLYPGEVTQYQNQTLTPISSFINEFIRTSIKGAQYVNQSTYHLTINGLVNQTLQYTYKDIVNNFQAQEEVVPLLCVEGWSANVLWKGVSVNDLLQAAGVSPQANTLIFNASDGYTTELPLNYVVQNHLILAYEMNNVTLTAQTGFPFILVAQNQYGYKWIKWITEINVSDNSGYLGYWESRGYPNNATIGNPNTAPIIPVSTVETLGFYLAIAGIAIAAYLIIVRIKNKRQKPPKAIERDT